MPEREHRPREHPPFRGQRFLLVLSTVLIAVAAFVVWPYRTPIVLALIIGYASWPVYGWLKERVKYESLAASIMLVLTTIALVTPLVIVGGAVMTQSEQISELVEDPEALAERFKEEVVALGVPPALADRILPRAASTLAQSAESVLVPAITAVTDLLIAFIVFFVLLFFVYVDGRDLVKYVAHVMPLDETRSRRLIDRTAERTKAILYGTILVGVIQGVVSAIGWWFFGYPAPLLVAFVMTVLAVIPFAGPFLLIIPAGLIGIAQGNLFGGIGLLVWGIGLGGIIDDVVRPYFIGKRSGVHPAIVLVGILGGFAVFGLAGFLIGPLLLGLLGPVLEAWSHPDEEPLSKAANGIQHDQSG